MDRRAITLQRLQAFCAVYERGSFSAAARFLTVSQPTISKHLRDLEAALKLSLFVLEGGRVSPTSEADWLYAESRFLTEGLQTLAGRIVGLRSGAGRRLSVASVGLLMHQHLPQALTGLRASMPELEIGVSSLSALEQISALRAGQFDIGFCAGLVEAPDLHQTTIGEGQLVLLVPKDHALALTARIDPAILSNLESLIRAPVDRPIGRLIEPYLKESVAEVGQITCYSLEAMAPLARCLGMVAIVDSFTAAALRGAELRAIPFDPPLRFKIHVLTARPVARQRSAIALIDAMRASLEHSSSHLA